MRRLEPSGPMRHRSGRARAARLSAACLAVLAAAACDLQIPTELPIVENEWRIPAEETRFGVDELLPSDVSLTTDSSAFLVDFDPVVFSETLGTLCPGCVPFDGTPVLKPEFTSSLTSQIDFPPEVSAATITDGAVVLEMQNGLNFDPIRPGVGIIGSVIIAITDQADGDTLAVTSLRGDTASFAAGSTRVDTIPLLPRELNGSIMAEVAVDSPEGDVVTIDVSDFLSVTATPTNIQVGGVEIDVANRSVTLDPVDLEDVEDIDSDLSDRVVGGSFILDVTNPFGVTAAFDVAISGPSIATIDKSATVSSAPMSTVTIDFTEAELDTFLGASGVQLTGGAVVDSGAPPITVTPGLELVLDADLQLTLRIGGGD